MANDKSNSSSKEKAKDTTLSETIKKVVSIGVGAAFMTEDAVKSVLNDLPLGKEIISGLVQNAKNAKEDFTEAIREELKKHLSKVDPQELLSDLVEKYDVEVQATLKFKRKETAKKPVTTNDDIVS